MAAMPPTMPVIGVATLPTTLAGTLTGTSDPATSVWVEIDCSAVLPSFYDQSHVSTPGNRFTVCSQFGANLLIE
jgi:hypothetical protein